MRDRYRLVKRVMIFCGIVTALVLIDGMVLSFTNGLKTDAQPIFPWLGGVWASKNRSSGFGLLIIGALAAAILLVGWFCYVRGLRARALAEVEVDAGTGGR